MKNSYRSALTIRNNCDNWSDSAIQHRLDNVKFGIGSNHPKIEAEDAAPEYGTRRGVNAIYLSRRGDDYNNLGKSESITEYR